MRRQVNPRGAAPASIRELGLESLRTDDFIQPTSWPTIDMIPSCANAAFVEFASAQFRLQGRTGEVRCSASDGKLELRAERDFSEIDRRRLEAAVQALLDQLAD